MIRTDLATILDAEPVQLVQPVRDGLAVPPERELERVVDAFFLFLLFSFFVRRLRRRGRGFGLLEQLLLAFARGQRESAFDVGFGVGEDGGEGGEEGGGQVGE